MLFSLGVVPGLPSDVARRVRVLNAVCVAVVASVGVFVLADAVAARPSNPYLRLSHVLAFSGAVVVFALHGLRLYRAAPWAALALFVAAASMSALGMDASNPVRYYLIVAAAAAAHLLRTRAEVATAFVLTGSLFVWLDTRGAPIDAAAFVRYVALFGFLYVSVFLYEAEMRRHVARVRRQRDELRSAHEALEATVETIREQHATLRRQANRLRDLGAVKDRVVSVLSHDLRSPLASLSMTLDLLDDEDASPEFRRECIAGVRQHLRASQEQLDDVLGWAEGLLAPTAGASDENGGDATPAETFDLAALVRRAVSHARPRADDKGIALGIDAPESLAVLGDASHVLLVLRNVLSNAVKFTAAGGTVRVEVGPEGDDAARVRLSDTGSGMDADTLRRVRGGTAAPSRPGTDGETGTGLGLRLAREFADLGGADLAIDSRPGAGTTVTLRLRRAPELSPGPGRAPTA